MMHSYSQNQQVLLATDNYLTKARMGVEPMIFGLRDRRLATWLPCPAGPSQILCFLPGKHFSTNDAELITKTTTNFINRQLLNKGTDGV